MSKRSDKKRETGGRRQEGHPRHRDLNSLSPDQMRELLAETMETNRLLREAEDRRRSETYNALTAGLYGVIRGLKSLREKARLIRELDEEIRQEELEKPNR